MRNGITTRNICSLLAAGAVIILVVSSVAYAGPDCTCRYKGVDVALGQSVCLNTPNGPRMARCDRVLNNTSWKFTDGPCPLARGPVPGPDLQTLMVRLAVSAPGYTNASNRR